MDETRQHEMAEPTEVRFGVRSLLVVMAVIAIGITALRPFLRAFPEVQAQLVIHWAIYLAMLAAAMGYFARRRYKAEQQAGAIAFVLPAFSYYTPRLAWIGRILAGSFLITCGSILWAALSFAVAFDDQTAWWMVLVNPYAYLAVYMASMGISNLWWWRSMRFCQHGIVAPTKLIPWSECRKWYWDASYRDVLVIEFHRHVRMEVKVQENDRAALEAFIAARKQDADERGAAEPFAIARDVAKPQAEVEAGARE